MKKILFSIAIIFALALTSCSSDKNSPQALANESLELMYEIRNMQDKIQDFSFDDMPEISSKVVALEEKMIEAIKDNPDFHKEYIEALQSESQKNPKYKDLVEDLDSLLKSISEGNMDEMSETEIGIDMDDFDDLEEGMMEVEDSDNK